MKKIYYFLLASFAMLSVAVACNTNDQSDTDEPNEEVTPTDPAAVAEYIGTWVVEDEGSQIRRIRLDDDFTGEIYYTSGDEWDYDYVFIWSVKDGQLTLQFNGLESNGESVKLVLGGSCDEKSGKLFLSQNGFTLSFTKQDIEWTGCVTTIFVGSWESDDAEEKIYMSFEPMAPFNNRGVGVVVADNVEIPVVLLQRNYAESSFHFLKAIGYLTWVKDPIIEGNLLKVNIFEKDRIFKPMNKWTFRTYDELIATGEWDKNSGGDPDEGDPDGEQQG
ncbi:MAG: hypothetical protein ACI3Y9_07810 [Candidatus Cryptobacteroides sp.]